MLTATIAKPDAAKLAVSGLFGRYKPEQEKEVRKVEVKEDEVLRHLKDAWKKFEYAEGKNERENYNNALKQLKGIAYSAKDVEKFSLALAGLPDEEFFQFKVGIFLSALINKGKDSDYVIHTNYLDREIFYFGYKNIKNIVVNGTVGPDLGCKMECGTITVNGNVGDEVGAFMKGGKIIVNGNATDYAGCAMKGGVIIVNGNAGQEIGDFMKGGELRLNGDYVNSSEDIKGGKIFHKGKLIFDNGKYFTNK